MNKSVARGIALALLSATSFYAAADAHLIRVGFNPGPYKEQFEKGVAPYLLSKGYKIEYKDFSDGIQVNDAVARGDIEANIMQHPVYLKAINERLGIDNVGIVQGTHTADGPVWRQTDHPGHPGSRHGGVGAKPAVERISRGAGAGKSGLGED